MPRLPGGGTATAPLDDRQSELAGRYFPAVAGFARRAARANPGLEDEIRYEAYLRLFWCAARWDESRGVRFWAFAAPWMRYVVPDARKHAGRRCRAPLRGLDFDPRARPEADGLADAEGFEALAARLPGRHAEVVRLIYRDGLTAAEAARSMGVCVPYAHALRNQALGLLRESLTARPREDEETPRADRH